MQRADYANLEERQQAIDEAVRVEPLAIEEEFVRIPADTAYWTARYADALRELLLARADTKRVFGRRWLEIREERIAAPADDKKSPRVTEAQVEAAIEGDPDYNAARTREIEAEVEKVRLGGVVDALRAKRDALISLGANMRAEMGSDPVLREQHQGRRRMDGARRGEE